MDCTLCCKPQIDGELTKPATLLIEKVCSAIGIIYEPTQIKRKAKAEAEAEKIKALTTIEITELEQRAINRLVQQQARKQRNIEQITSQAAAELPPEANVKDLDEDWVAHFFEQCENVSDNEMQTVWAKLLCGEATSPGTYSKRAVNFVSTIDKKDADLFTKFCRFIWKFGEDNPLIFDVKDDVYKKQGINFPALKHLDAIGLISFEPLSGFAREGFIKNGMISYYGRPLLIEFQSESNNQIRVGQVLLTDLGMQLTKICGSEPDQEFYEYAVKKMHEQGLILSSFPQSYLF